MRASNETEHFLYDYINIENKNILWEWSENILTVKREETWQLRDYFTCKRKHVRYELTPGS